MRLHWQRNNITARLAKPCGHLQHADPSRFYPENECILASKFTLPPHTMSTADDLATLKNEYGLNSAWMSEYHIRIEGILDVWPTSHKWYSLATKKNGQYQRLVPFVSSHFSCPKGATCPNCHHRFFSPAL